MGTTTIELDITAAGLLTSVGHDVFTACASIRAGLSRPQPVEEFKVLELSTAEPVPLVAHPIAPVTDGFVGAARWLQMAPLAFADMQDANSLPAADDATFWGRCALMVALPDLDGDRFVFDARVSSEAIGATFGAPLRSRLPPALPSSHIRIQPLDRMALPVVLEQSASLLQQLPVDRIIVLAVDSLVDPFALDWLGETGRLKSDANPVGLKPGECAAALLLERSRRGAHDERPAWATVTTVSTDRDAPAGQPGASSRGRALARVLRAMGVGRERVDLYSDLNGETWRARELGNALVDLEDPEIALHHPASEVGDVGAASSMLHTIVGARSLQRGYAGSERVVVSISGHGGDVGALALRRASER